MNDRTPAVETNSAARSSRRHELPLDQIRAALEGLQFGNVSVIVQDGVVVQIERTERHRLHAAKRA